MKLNKGLLKLMVLLTLCICLNGVSAYAVPDEVPVKTVNVALKNSEKRTLKFKKGQKLQMLRFGMKMKRTTFTSSKPAVATVSSTGLIRTKKVGSTTITVSSRGYTCKYKLKVTAKNTIYDMANKYSRNMKYFIMVDRAKTTVYILKKNYGEYRLLKTFRCCVGKPSTPTPAGSYSIRGKGDYFVTDGNNRCWYFSQFVGAFMFHSQVYSPADTPSVLVDGSMGVACTHGCVRLYIKNAKWIKDKIPFGTRVLIV